MGATVESRLLRAAAGGDPSAWELLVERILPDLWATALSFGLDDRDATDVCGVVSVRLAQSLHEVATSGALAAWLARTGREECSRAAAEAALRRAPVVDLQEAAKRRAAAGERIAIG
ncbi:MAG TPA: sigma factor [Mycobacteriales bacterium]|nr:sigma factor [Mycobacteriales bacterium]